MPKKYNMFSLYTGIVTVALLHHEIRGSQHAVPWIDQLKRPGRRKQTEGHYCAVAPTVHGTADLQELPRLFGIDSRKLWCAQLSSSRRSDEYEVNDMSMQDCRSLRPP